MELRLSLASILSLQLKYLLKSSSNLLLYRFGGWVSGIAGNKANLRLSFS